MPARARGTAYSAAYNPSLWATAQTHAQVCALRIIRAPGVWLMLRAACCRVAAAHDARQHAACSAPHGANLYGVRRRRCSPLCVHVVCCSACCTLHFGVCPFHLQVPHPVVERGAAQSAASASSDSIRLALTEPSCCLPQLGRRVVDLYDRFHVVFVLYAVRPKAVMVRLA
jgi:hypothetical protein